MQFIASCAEPAAMDMPSIDGSLMPPTRTAESRQPGRPVSLQGITEPTEPGAGVPRCPGVKKFVKERLQRSKAPPVLVRKRRRVYACPSA